MCIGYPPWSIRSYNLCLGLDQITNGRINYKMNCFSENLTNFSLFRMEELHQDQQPPHHQPLLHHHLQMVVDPHNGPLINGVMMKTTMLVATTMVELVATIMPKDGIITAQYGTFLLLIFILTILIFKTFIGLCLP